MNQAIPNLYGLKICISPSPFEEGDLIWKHETVEDIAHDDRPSHFTTQRDGCLWAHHIYGFPDKVICEFSISPDGQRVFSRSRSTLPQQDLLTLFAEPVMRSVFRARDITSFHGAALERNGRAVLLLGAKEAGKSTAAAMLMQSGWTLLSDDLVRVKQNGDHWMVPTGFCHLKISLHTAQTLGFDPHQLHRRWTIPGAPEDSRINKFVLECNAPALPETPLHAIFVIGERGPRDSGIQLKPMSGVDRLRALFGNLTIDPCIVTPPSPEQLRIVNRLLSDIEVQAVSFPNGIISGLTLPRSFQ
ncbi:hypothetical protein [Terriglobus sp. RCC_193]|uniref:hypothetical protein n=1 Tax=Terriglobus sp. RCC_193 TaxID=3239218 RepID=UPI00352380DC